MDILNEFDNGEIHYRHAVDEHPDGADYSFHIHDKCEIFYFVSGRAQYLVEGSVYPLEKGSLLVMRPGESHCPQILAGEKYERYAVNFPSSLFDILDPGHLLQKPFFARQLGRKNMYTIPELEYLFTEMSVGSDEFERQLNINTCLLRILTVIRSEFTGKEKEAPRRQTPAESLVSYVNEHLFEELTPEILCSRFYISSSKLQRIFKQSTGATVWEFVNAKRLEAVKAMITSGIPAGRAALSCGFGDYSSFYRAYVKRFGECPRSSVKPDAS